MFKAIISTFLNDFHVVSFDQIPVDSMNFEEKRFGRFLFWNSGSQNQNAT
jgi:hypothetical protein